MIHYWKFFAKKKIFLVVREENFADLLSTGSAERELVPVLLRITLIIDYHEPSERKHDSH